MTAPAGVPVPQRLGVNGGGPAQLHRARLCRSVSRRRAFFYLLLVAALSPSSEKERRTSRRIILFYIVVFLACWLPFHAVLLVDTLSLLNLLPFGYHLENFLAVALQLTQCLSLLHCCINPVQYTSLSRNCRYDLMKVFIFHYSSRTGLARLMEGSQASEAVCSAMDDGAPPM